MRRVPTLEDQVTELIQSLRDDTKLAEMKAQGTEGWENGYWTGQAVVKKRIADQLEFILDLQKLYSVYKVS